MKNYSNKGYYTMRPPGFPLDFVVNEQDTMQGTGNTNEYKDSADDIMISSVWLRLRCNYMPNMFTEIAVPTFMF